MENENSLNRALEIFYCEYTMSIIEEIDKGLTDAEIINRLLSEKDDLVNAASKTQYIRFYRNEILAKIKTIKSKWKKFDDHQELELKKSREESENYNRHMEKQRENFSHASTHLGFHLIKSFFGV